jgi:hypothetical protein
MREKIDEEVSVIYYYAAKHKKTVPHLLHWQNKDYSLGKVDYYHSFMEGRERMHIFELCDKEQTIWFRLKFDSSNLHWTLEAIHDGLAR